MTLCPCATGTRALRRTCKAPASGCWCRKNPQTIIQIVQLRCRRYSGTSADMYRTIFGLLVSLKLFLGRFDMRTMQARTSVAQNKTLVGVTHSADAVSLGISVTSINGGVGSYVLRQARGGYARANVTISTMLMSSCISRRTGSHGSDAAGHGAGCCRRRATGTPYLNLSDRTTHAACQMT